MTISSLNFPSGSSGPVFIGNQNKEWGNWLNSVDLNKKTLNSVVGISRSDGSKKIVYCHDFTKGQQSRRFSALSPTD